LNLTIIGGGSWGTALAIALAPRFQRVKLRIYEPDLAMRMRMNGTNDVYLPGFRLPSNVEVVLPMAAALQNAHIVLCVVPSAFARETYLEALPHLNASMIFVSATKGLEHRSLLRMSEVLVDSLRPKLNARVAVLSGPTFAREVAVGQPTTVVIASEDAELSAQIQAAFSGPSLRLYTSTDPIGVELGGALKNVIAIAAGVVQGLGLGSNTTAALITRGLAEITRLAVAMGAKPQTLAGLAGLGDLVLTCTGDLSRNRTVGIALAKGLKLKEIIASTPMVAEGIETCSSAVALGEKFDVDLPIMNQMHAVLYSGKAPLEAIRSLMDRSLKQE
jgi:glycerol-3-phosphate dehydrogenase (NAD(P)+)